MSPVRSLARAGARLNLDMGLLSRFQGTLANVTEGGYDYIILGGGTAGGVLANLSMCSLLKQEIRMT